MPQEIDWLSTVACVPCTIPFSVTLVLERKAEDYLPVIFLFALIFLFTPDFPVHIITWLTMVGNGKPLGSWQNLCTLSLTRLWGDCGISFKSGIPHFLLAPVRFRRYGQCLHSECSVHSNLCSYSHQARCPNYLMGRWPISFLLVAAGAKGFLIQKHPRCWRWLEWVWAQWLKPHTGLLGSFPFRQPFQLW